MYACYICFITGCDEISEWIINICTCRTLRVWNSGLALIGAGLSRLGKLF